MVEIHEPPNVKVIEAAGQAWANATGVSRPPSDPPSTLRP
jgi:hypothetical protein